MTFEHEHTVTTTASPADVWALWSDVGSWHCWDPAVQQVALEGHFAEGAAGSMVLTSGVSATFVLEIVEPGKRYLDRVTMGDLVISVDHEVRATDDGAEVTDEVGPMVTEDAPRALAALVEMAERKSA
jgi:hypothetical protein